MFWWSFLVYTLEDSSTLIAAISFSKWVYVSQGNSENEKQMHCKFSVVKEKCFPRLLAAGSHLLLSSKPYRPPSCKGIHNCRQHRGCTVSVRATYHLQSDGRGCSCQAGCMGIVVFCSLVILGVISIVVSTMSLVAFDAISFSMERDNLLKQITLGRTGLRPAIFACPWLLYLGSGTNFSPFMKWRHIVQQAAPSEQGIFGTPSKRSKPKRASPTSYIARFPDLAISVWNVNLRPSVSSFFEQTPKKMWVLGMPLGVTQEHTS